MSTFMQVNRKGIALGAKSGTPALLLALPDHIASVGNDNYGSYDTHRKGNTWPWSEKEQSVMRQFTIKWVAGQNETHTHPGRLGRRYNTKRGITDKAGKKLDELYPEDFCHGFRRTIER